jgi:hypothetical protein
MKMKGPDRTDLIKDIQKAVSTTAMPPDVLEKAKKALDSFDGKQKIETIEFFAEGGYNDIWMVSYSLAKEVLPPCDDFFFTLAAVPCC